MSQEPMNNFTPRAQQVLALARKEADRFHHNYVGTEHILLGLIKLGQGVAVSVLQKMGLDLETVRNAVEKQVGTGQETKTQSSIPYTPRVKKVLALAGKEAKTLNHSYVGTEHILLGLLREGEGVAARVLKSLDIDIERTRNEILRELDPQFSGSQGAEGPAEEAVAGSPQRPAGQAEDKKEVKTPALKAFGRDLTELDLHRPHVDNITFTCNTDGCTGTMRRVAPVLDAWFDSGSMPSAQRHHPFENADSFNGAFPADFICEAIDQTRGWFYSLLAVNSLVFDSTPYKNVVCLALIVDDNGQKKSKARGNVMEPCDFFDPRGADALRWY
jgi:hypothetical protein